ncbi:MAG: thioredoxin family protein [Patescibacteria group bacterium]|jgi:thiol-disulfide isomerase/thioredoxin|nr:thioredoxin family protein [Patescibacteria group bacterium]
MKVLKFGAVWCPGCVIMKPRWQEIEAELPWLKTEYYEYDDHPELIEQYQIGQEIPVFIFLDKDGKEFARFKGEISKKELIEFVKNNKNK